MKVHWGNDEDRIVGYQYPVWSNYFGCTRYPNSVPLGDKLLFAKSTTNDDAMFYITQYAFMKLTIYEINDHRNCTLYTSPSPRDKANLVCRLLLEKKKKENTKNK